MFTFTNFYLIENEKEFLFYKKGTRTIPLGMTYISIDAPWHKKQKYDRCKVSIPKVFKIFEYFSLQRIGTTPMDNLCHTIWCSITQATTWLWGFISRIFPISKYLDFLVSGEGDQKYPHTRPVYHLIAERTKTSMV